MINLFLDLTYLSTITDVLLHVTLRGPIVFQLMPILRTFKDLPFYFLILFILFKLFILLYNIVLILPYTDLNLPYTKRDSLVAQR